MGKRCQVCDGPIVDGRCKYCGMPYRNDAAMYHLNEDRSEHYRHASAKVRKAMAESEIPLPDRDKSSGRKEKIRNASGNSVQRADRRPTEIKSADTAGMWSVQRQNVKTQTMKQQAANAQTVKKKKADTYSNSKTSVSGTKPKRKRKNKKMAIFWAALLGLVILGESMPDYPERIADAVETFINEKPGTETENPLSDDSTLLTDQDELENYYSFYIDTDSEACVVGESELFFEEDLSDVADSDENSILCAGEYVIESSWEDVALKIREPSGEVQTIKFDEAKQKKKVELHNGYELTAVSLDAQYNYITFYKIQQYDE